MIKLNDPELAQTGKNPDLVAQLLVRKAIEEEMVLKPFSEEERKQLENIKKNVEIEYFLNLRAEGKITVNDLEILELYRNNLAVLKDKKVEEIFPQLKQAVFNQKLGAEKAAIVNELVEKYGLNALLKEYVPELDINTETDSKIQRVPVPEEPEITAGQAEESVQDVSAEKRAEVIDVPRPSLSATPAETVPDGTVPTEAQNEPGPAATQPAEPVMAPVAAQAEVTQEEPVEPTKDIAAIIAAITAQAKAAVTPEPEAAAPVDTPAESASPIFDDKALFERTFSTPVESTVPGKPVVEPLPEIAEAPVEAVVAEAEPEALPAEEMLPPMEDEKFGGGEAVSREELAEILKDPPGEPAPEAPSGQAKETFDVPKVVFDDSILKAPTVEFTPVAPDVEEQKIALSEAPDEEGESPNMPFSFGNFNFKID